MNRQGIGMQDEVGRNKLDQLKQAAGRLRQGTDDPALQEEYKLDVMIQRFELAYDLAWKLLKHVLLEQGIRAISPLEVFREAFPFGWLGEDPELWHKMIRDRNDTTHTYHPKHAAYICDNIRLDYLPALERLCAKLELQ